MRLMVAMLQERKGREIETCLDAGPFPWDVVRARDGEEALGRLCRDRFDLLLLHGHLPKLEGSMVLQALWEEKLACPPRVLLLTEPELRGKDSPRADCVAPIMAGPQRIARLLEVLAAKPMPLLATKTQPLRLQRIQELLKAIGLRSDLKGEAYITWLLGSDPARAASFFEAASFSKYSPRKSVDDFLTTQTAAKDDEWMQVISSQIIPHSISEPLYAWDVSANMLTAMGEVIVNGATPQEALKAAADAINQFIQNNDYSTKKPQ